jgi:hypothetical protein
LEIALIVWLVGVIGFGIFGATIVNKFAIVPLPRHTILILILADLFWPITLVYVTVKTAYVRLTEVHDIPVVKAEKPKKK